MKSIIFIFLLTTTVVFGQGKAPKGFIQIDRNAENVNLVMSYENPTVAQLDTLIQLGRNYTQTNKDTTFLLIEKTIEHTKDNNDWDYQKQYGRVLSSKGIALSKFGKGEESIEVMMKAKSVFEKVGHELGKASVDRFLGSHYSNVGKLKESAFHYLSSIEIYKKTTIDPRAFLGPYQGLFDVYFDLGNYQKAQHYLSEAILIADTTNSVFKESDLRIDQALLFFEIGNQYDRVADTLVSNSSIYRDSANQFFQNGLSEASLALSASKEINDNTLILISLSTIAKIKNRINDFQGAKTVTEEALIIARKLEDPKLLTTNKINLATALYGLGQYQRATAQTESALQLCNQNNFNFEKLSAYDLLIKLYLKTRNPEKTINILAKRNKFEKELNNNSTKKAVAEAETKYQTAEKENQILLQENDILELESQNAKIQKQKNYMIGGGLLFSLLGFFGYRINKVQKDRNDKKQFAEALLFAQEEERKRIGRDLHDGIGQSLLLIKKQMNVNQKVSLENQTMITETLEEVRSISRDLHPFHLEKFGLTYSIENIVEKIGKSTDLFISKEIDNIDNLLESKSEIHIFRTIQEAFNNIIKHAEASAAKIEVTQTTDIVNIIIQDNGKGFDHELTIVKSKSLGLRTMSERIAAIGGKFQINKGENGGIVIEISVPKKN